MNDLPLTRALVIDDQANEAAPVLQALQLLGITSLFYDGGADFPLPDKVGGPRLLFLDMVLGEHGAQEDDPKSCIEVLLAALERAVDFAHGPYLVVAWTAHAEMPKLFAEEFKQRYTNHSTTVFLEGRKPTVGDFYKPETLKQLHGLIQRGLKDFGSAGLLMQWECLVSGAAKQTTNRLFDLAASGCDTAVTRAHILNRINGLCGTLAFAEGGMRAANGSASDNVASLLSALQPLVADQLEHTELPSSFASSYGDIIKSKAGEFLKQRNQLRDADVDREAEASAMFYIWNRLGCDVASACSASQNGDVPSTPANALDFASKLNSMLLMSGGTSGKSMPPGTLYSADQTANSASPLPFTAENVIKNCFLLGKQQPAELVLVECTPTCDFAQNKRALPRCVAAVLTPVPNRSSMPKGAEFLRFFGPIEVPNSPLFPGDPVWLVVNSHFVTSLLPEKLKPLKCLGRLRSQAMADMMAWLGGHMSRPGYASV